jgi:hypothetical protein
MPPSPHPFQRFSRRGPLSAPLLQRTNHHASENISNLTWGIQDHLGRHNTHFVGIMVDDWKKYPTFKYDERKFDSRNLCAQSTQKTANKNALNQSPKEIFSYMSIARARAGIISICSCIKQQCGDVSTALGEVIMPLFFPVL